MAYLIVKSAYLFSKHVLTTVVCSSPVTVISSDPYRGACRSIPAIAARPAEQFGRAAYVVADLL